MPLTHLVFFIFKGISKSITVELESFFSSLGISGNKITKQAFSKSRMKLKPEAFVTLNDKFVEEIYKNKHRLYKGYRLLSVDGSKIQLPSGKEVESVFGKMGHNKKSLNTGTVITFYDPLNDKIVESKLYKYAKGERAGLLEGIKTIKSKGKQRKDIIIGDRGFYSLEVIYELMESGYDFILRYNGDKFIRETRGFYDSKEKDVEITIDLEKITKYNRISKFGQLKERVKDTQKQVRLVKVDIGEGKTEYLITSLIDKKEISITDMKKLYGLRWQHEESFKLIKSTGELENISGRKEKTILQDFYAKVFMMNLFSEMAKQADSEVKKEKTKEKREKGKKAVENSPKRRKEKGKKYKINRNVGYGIAITKLVRLFIDVDSDWEKIYYSIITEIKKYIIEVKPGRKNKRVFRPNCKYPANRRRAV